MRKVVLTAALLTIALIAGCGDKPKEGKQVDPKDVNKVSPVVGGKKAPGADE